MLSAMAASTGGPGTRTTPSVASARVIECATVKAVMVRKSTRRSANDQDERQHEEEMIEAEEDVLDPVREIGTHYRERSAGGRDFDPRLRRPDDRGRARTVSERHPHQHVRDGALQSGELDARLPASPSSPASSTRRSSNESVSSCTVGSATSRTPSGSFSTTGRRMPERTGVRQSTA